MKYIQFETRKELLKQMSLGEDQLMEFKSVYCEKGKIRGPKQSELADEIAAFANSQGGMLVLGVDDHTRDISGIPLELVNDAMNMVV